MEGTSESFLTYSVVCDVLDDMIKPTIQVLIRVDGKVLGQDMPFPNTMDCIYKYIETRKVEVSTDGGKTWELKSSH